MKAALKTQLLLLLTQLLGLSTASQDTQVVLTPPTAHHDVDAKVLAALSQFSDPVDAMVAIRPEALEELSRPRLLHVAGEPQPQWMTEGDKLRLRRKHKKFADITDHHEFYGDQVGTLTGKANLPKLFHQRLVKPLFSQISTKRMYGLVEHLTSYYTRYYGSTTGEQSALWIHDHLASIIEDAPFRTHISLEYFTHVFPQPSIIARFEPKVANFSSPLTILGAHQDSMNYLFPLLPSPGADDDCSGSVSILEAFRILAESGFTPKDGPVEFHWYAAEEGGLLGSQAIARYKKESGQTIGAMLEFDMTAFIARNATESIGLIETEADPALTKWVLDLAREYSPIKSAIYKLSSGAGSDYMSYTKLGYPASLASEGNPLARGGFPGEFDPYIHTVNDTMHVDDAKGFFSIEHMARFTELAIAFVVEQAGWDNAWR